MKKLLLLLLMVLLAVPAYAMQTPEIDLGGHVRFRGYSMENFWTFDSQDDTDNWSVFRLRTQLKAGTELGDNVSGFIRLTNQNYSEGVTYDDEWEKDNESNKIFVDNAYIDINNLFRLPLSLRLGRQDLMYGTGFVLFDGQSQYASTSIYFDGIKLTWDITDQTKLDLLYMKDQENERADGFDDDITLSGGYLTAHCPIIGGQQEAYILNRSDEDFGKDIWMYGLRLSDRFDCGLDYSGEIAYQGGEFNEGTDTDQDALGYKLETGYTFDIAVNPRFFLGYTSLSGDEPDTSDSEAWDVFYGGWPQFGDLLAWSFVNIPPNVAAAPVTGAQGIESVTGEANYTNLQMPKIGLSCKLNKWFAQISYTMLKIDEVQTPGADDDFGDYYQMRAKYQYSKYLSFAGYAAMIEPGDAFAADANSSYETFWETRIDF